MAMAMGHGPGDVVFVNYSFLLLLLFEVLCCVLLFIRFLAVLVRCRLHAINYVSVVSL